MKLKTRQVEVEAIQWNGRNDVEIKLLTYKKHVSSPYTIDYVISPERPRLILSPFPEILECEVVMFLEDWLVELPVLILRKIWHMLFSCPQKYIIFEEGEPRSFCKRCMTEEWHFKRR